MVKKNGIVLNLSKGFTLVEVLVVIAITTLFVISGIATYINTLKSSRDTRRKSDLGSIQKGLELYYSDSNAYPTLTGALNYTQLCGSGFNAGGAACTGSVYIQVLPTDPLGSSYYYKSTDGTNYKLYSSIEKSDDTGTGVNQSGYASTSCISGATCKYGVASSNTTP